MERGEGAGSWGCVLFCLFFFLTRNMLQARFFEPGRLSGCHLVAKFDRGQALAWSVVDVLLSK